MARIFAGADRRQIDNEVLEAFKALPDDFWVFAEFTIGRNIDWFVVHPSSDGRTMALIMVELKRSSAPLAGDVNNTWRQWTGADWRELVPGGPSRNYYWQAVEAANELKEWLWNNQRRYRNGAEVLPPEAFKVWPDLLILSPPGVTHQLPLKPPNNFGRFLTSIEECVRHVASWNARERNLVPLAEGELERLAAALGLERIWPLTGQPAPPAEPDLRQVLALLQRLDERLQRLEHLLTPGKPGSQSSPTAQRLAPQRKAGPPAADGVDPGPPPTTGQPGATAPTPASLRKVFGWIEAYLRERGRPCPFTTLGTELKKRHGLDVKAQYKMTFTNLLRQAEQEGRVRVSQLNGFPHASLPDAPPAAAAEPPATSVLEKLGDEWLGEAVRVIAAAEDAIGGRPVQTGSLAKELREALPWKGGPELSAKEASQLLKQELARIGYVKPVECVTGVDGLTGLLRRAQGYRLDREQEAVRYLLERGAATLRPEVVIRPLQGDDCGEPLPVV